MNKFKIGSLVRRKSYQGVLNSLHSPSYYGVIVGINSSETFEVVWILRGGETRRKNLRVDQLTLIC